MPPTQTTPPPTRGDPAFAACPLVTVIIPTFNWSTVLPFSIGSALGQTFRDIEVLVVGDGCTDDSEATVRSIGDPRVRWINLPRNSGHQSAPNNEGLRQARGELIAYLGHDDLWLPHHLARAVAALSERDDLVYGITAAVHPDGGVQFMPPRFVYRPGASPPPSSVVHRRSMAEALGGWRPAQWRRDAYRIRACDEQADWSRRMKEEPDLEAAVLGRLVESAGGPQALRLVRYPDLLREVFSEAVERARFRLSGRSPAVFFGTGKGKQLDVYRRFKGLPPAGTAAAAATDDPDKSEREKDPC